MTHRANPEDHHDQLDWRGEHLIRRRPTATERKIAGCSAMASTIAEMNRRKGIKPRSAADHDRFVRGVFKDLSIIIKMESRNDA